VLAKLRANARQQHGEAERLGDVIVGARLQTKDGIGVRIVPGQHDDRRFEAAFSQDADRFPAVDVRQAHVHDDEVDLTGLHRLHAFGARFDRTGLEFVVQSELFDKPAAKLVVIVNDQDFSAIGH
jgi:hypothetical protein